MNAVEIEGVSKSFGTKKAVDNLSLKVPEGCVYGFIGPNGSGKSTTLRMIMRIILQDEGHIRVLGAETGVAANDRIGYMPEERSTYKKMKVRELLRFHAELKGMRDPGPAIEDWITRLRMEEHAEKKIEALSKGNAQKIQFIATVVANPSLAILDEPFSGLDPVNREVLREAVLHLKQRGSTVIFSTHDMAVAEEMCDSIFMIYRGKKVLDGTLEEIRDRYGEDTLRVRLEGAGGAAFDHLPGVQSVTDLGNLRELRMERGCDTQRLLGELMSRGRVHHFEKTRPRLNDIFVRIARPTAETDEDEETSDGGLAPR